MSLPVGNKNVTYSLLLMSNRNS